MKKEPGKVYLVGGGPGDAGLLTVKGAACLRRAAHVVYDALVNPSLLELAPAGTNFVYVGKRGAQHAMEQGDINRLLVELARRGGDVVRLKGGDPFVFGRGGEEASELAAEKISFEVVPGVSSAIAAPAYAGIPVTDRRHSPMVTFLTGHAKADGELDLPWQALAAGGGTLVFLMGVSNLALITKRLMEAGLKGSTPAAVVSSGTTPRQRSVEGRLSDLAELAVRHGIKAPAVTIVGGVASLRKELAWFERRPLFGRRIAVTRAREQASGLAEKLAELGAEPILFPAIKIAPRKDNRELDAHIRGLAGFDWVVFTSVNGVEAFFARVRALGLDARAFGRAKAAAIGPATAEALLANGIAADCVPPKYVAEAILKKLGKVKGLKVLLPRAAMARDALRTGLEKGGASVAEAPVYDTVADAGNLPALTKLIEAGELDLVTFTSSSTVNNFLDNFPDKKLLKGVAFGSIGPVTSATLRERGYKPAFEAKEYTVPGLVAAALAYFRKEKKA